MQQPDERPAPAEPAAAPAAEPQPDGAYARFRASDGSTEAWLRTDEGDDPVGYLRDNSANPAVTVRYTNPAHWATDVDQQGMAPVDHPGADQQGQEQEQRVSEVADALQALADGERTLDDVEAFFRERDWPRHANDQGDHVPGSFAEVADAYSGGQIDHDQYVRLAAAATEAMRQQSGIGDQQQ
jgi:hypothetical protein